MKHDESKLPVWVQNKIKRLQQKNREQNEEMKRLRQAHEILFGRKNWFPIPGPPDLALTQGGCFRLFYLSNDGAHPACSLYTGDVLLIGRAE